MFNQHIQIAMHCLFAQSNISRLIMCICIIRREMGQGMGLGGTGDKEREKALTFIRKYALCSFLPKRRNISWFYDADSY